MLSCHSTTKIYWETIHNNVVHTRTLIHQLVFDRQQMTLTPGQTAQEDYFFKKKGKKA